MDKTRIIVVEDNIVYCEFVCNLLAREGFRTVQAYHLSTAKKLLQQASDGDIVVSDLRLPDGDGIDLLRWMRKEGMTQPLIIMTNYAEVHTAVESMKLGSLDYIPKQLVEDKLMPLLHTILKERSIGRNRMPVFARDSSAFQKIMQQIRLVAPTDMSVLIFGENGTGKEHIAHHLHDKSKRAGKPFVPVDCGSLSKDLAPSAFFGHVKGAFTGADSTKKGYFNEAEGGTLFLDEVGNLALETQQMLLRAIQERRYRPIGDKTDKSCTAPQKLDTFGVFFMKYNYEIRLKAVKLVLEGGLSVREAGCHLGCGRSQVHLWVTLFERHGLAGLKLRHGSYSAEFKLSVLKHMHQNHLSLLETAVHFGIPGPFVIRQWERLYQNQGAEGLRRKPQRRRPAMSKSKTKKVKLKTTPHEELLKELEYLRAENAYLKKLQALVEERIVRESGKEPKPSKD